MVGVLEILEVGHPHRLECSLAGETFCRRREALFDPVEAVVDRREEERLLRPEEPEEVGLGDSCPACDLIGRGPRGSPSRRTR